VPPTRQVPQHIIKPEYVNNPNPVFGIYSGPPVIHDKETIESIKNFFFFF
jgi:hypothetical protein